MEFLANFLSKIVLNLLKYFSIKLPHTCLHPHVKILFKEECSTAPLPNTHTKTFRYNSLRLECTELDRVYSGKTIAQPTPFMLLHFEQICHSWEWYFRIFLLYYLERREIYIFLNQVEPRLKRCVIFYADL